MDDTADIYGNTSRVPCAGDVYLTAAGDIVLITRVHRDIGSDEHLVDVMMTLFYGIDKIGSCTNYYTR